MRVSYAPGYYAPLPEGHIFPMKKFTGLHRFLLDEQVIQPSDVILPSPADETSLLSVHSRTYVRAILKGELDRKQQRRLGLPWSRRLALRSRLAVQGTINAGLMALEDGIAGNIAGGTHHALPDYGEGFCVFNDVAVAIKVLQQSMWARKILVIDCDVHQGNGTAEIFKNNPDVFTFSLHGAKNYPFKKPPSSLDIGLPDNTGDRLYLDTLEEALDDIFSQFEPDLVFYLGGIDPLESDHFGRLSLSLQGLAHRDELVIRKVTGHNAALVLLLSGGYAPTVEAIVRAHALMYKAGREYAY